MDSSNLAVLWWPNLFQPQFHDLRTAEQICQTAKPLTQTIIDNYSIIFTSEQLKEKSKVIYFLFLRLIFVLVNDGCFRVVILLFFFFFFLFVNGELLYLCVFASR